MATLQQTDEQRLVVREDGHLLVTGGPGSGKTTVSILRAARIAEQRLETGQRVLFLSFARASVARVLEAIENEQVATEWRRRMEVATYHAFFWRIVRTHGYLLGLPRRLSILLPNGEAVALASIRLQHGRRSGDGRAAERRRSAEDTERRRLAMEEGRVAFDLIAPLAAKLVAASRRIREIVAIMYPSIILDEFQDTNAPQWEAVRAVGQECELTALADPEQRIFDFIGADPKRLHHFRAAFSPKEVDLGDQNHRSAGTEIADFGRAILDGRIQKRKYAGVTIREYPGVSEQAYTALVTATYKARKRVVAGCASSWSVAVLVPTKRMTRLVSDRFLAPPAGMKSVRHTAVIDLEATVLAGEIVACLMEVAGGEGQFPKLIELMCNYYEGKSGENPTVTEMRKGQAIRKAYADWDTRRAQGRAPRSNSFVIKSLAVHETVREMQTVGRPEEDWRRVRSVLEKGECQRLREVAQQVRNLRLLTRGTQLRQQLSEAWRNSSGYENALSIVRQALVQDQALTSTRTETGVVVMNMHKAKGKQFDEVILFERWPVRIQGQIKANPDRFVRGNMRSNATTAARQNFRVSVTRAKRRTTILTPDGDPCVLLV